MFSIRELWTMATHIVALTLIYYACHVCMWLFWYVTRTAPAITLPAPSSCAPPPSSSSGIPSSDPATLEMRAPVPVTGAEAVREVIERARRAQEDWRKTSFEVRRRLLVTMLRCITEHTDDIVQVACRDSGKTPVDALLGEVLTTCEKLRWLIARGEAALAPEWRDSGLMNLHKSSRVEWVPVGVVGAIVPWNYPFHNVFNPLTAAVFAGNAIVIKASEHAAWSTLYYQTMIDACLAAAGAPPGLVQIVNGYGETGAALLSGSLQENDAGRNPAPSPITRAGGPQERGVDLLIFVGSVQVGQIVAKAAAASLTPVVLELGGKDPFVVLDDVDPAAIVQLALRGVFQNAGQNCAGPERFLVYEGIYDRFIDAVAPFIRKMRVGSGANDATVDCGALRMPNAAAVLADRVAEAVKQGARLICGGKVVHADKGQFLEPTLLVDVTDNMDIAQEEIFGPIMCVFKVAGNSDDEAVRIANHCSFALGACVFGNDQARASAVGRRIRSGMLSVDDIEGTTYLSQSLPFGGPARSGGGRFAGVEGLRGLCYPRAIVQNRLSFLKASIPPPLQYPSNGAGPQFLAGLLQILYGYSLSARLQGIWTLITAKPADTTKPKGE